MYYVYAHYKQGSKLPFYVGKGNGTRDRSLNRSTDWKKTVKDSKFIVERLHDNLTEDDAFYFETIEILRYGRLDIHTGCLINKTNGGGGLSEFSSLHYKMDSESRRRRSERQIKIQNTESVRTKRSKTMKEIWENRTYNSKWNGEAANDD